MKKFTTLLEDIYGGYFPEEGKTRVNRGGARKIKNLDELVKKIGTNFAPEEITQFVDLDDNFKVALAKSDGENISTIKAHVISKKPGHENTALMTYGLSSREQDVYRHGGREHRIYSGVPQKLRTDTRRGVFKSPKNLIHTIVDTLGVAVMSGGIQSPGAISMWRRAVRHGHENDNPALRVVSEVKPDFEHFPPQYRKGDAFHHFVPKGTLTPRNLSDVYTGDISYRKTGNKSKLLSGTRANVPSEIDAPEELKKKGSRGESRILVLPKG
jgi:hypothetical protein